MAKRRRMIKLIILLIEVVIVAVLIVGMVFVKNLGLYNQVGLDNINKNELNEETLASFSGYTTIALFGLDNREFGELDTGLSDVIMIVSINNDTKDIKLVSVYRDTYLDVGPEGEKSFNKANSAYAFGGPERAVSMLNKNLDLDIDSYITFDFYSVAEAVDIMGGVTVEITSEAELEELNRVIDETNWYLDRESPLIDSLGEHTLDGVQAVSYARIRKLEGGDYKRAQRQRIILSKMMEKAKDANLVTLNKLIKTVMPDIQSDLSEADLISMARVMVGYDFDDSRGFPFERTTRTLPSAGSSVIPCDLETNVGELHEYLYEVEDYEPSDTVQTYSDIIVERSGCTVDSAEDDQFNEGDDFSGNAPESLPAEGETGDGEDTGESDGENDDGE